MKLKAAEEVGIAHQHVTLPAEASVDEIVRIVKGLNDDEAVSGIIVQLPLGPHVGPDGERTVTEAVSPEKDVDGCALPFRSAPHGFPRASFRQN
jgi:methylenetetrahydrofolate dehydrogenase (NADP+)/methenyltetrahydrofolate cyclohydrolase/formyltetrahydrofolate synthetase